MKPSHCTYFVFGKKINIDQIKGSGQNNLLLPVGLAGALTWLIFLQLKKVLKELLASFLDSQKNTMTDIMKFLK